MHRLLLKAVKYVVGGMYEGRRQGLTLELLPASGLTLDATAVHVSAPCRGSCTMHYYNIPHAIKWRPELLLLSL